MENNTVYYYDYSPYFPDPITCFREFFVTFGQELNNRLPWNGVGLWFKETWQSHYMAFYLNRTDVWNIVLMALFLTLLRMFLNFALLKRIPRWLGLGKRDGEKFPESLWKFSVYSVTWSWAIYICFFSHPQYFYDLRSHWHDFILGKEISPVEYWLYILQLGFYVHCAYASVFIETIRKDFAVLMIHHFLTLGLLGYSLAVRYHPIGLLVLFVQDIGDICLEGAKTVVYCKVRNGVKHAFPEIVADIMFAIFTLEWILCRLYWYPTKVLYSSGVVCMAVYANGPFYLPFNVMLLFLYAMQVYWFGFIVKLLVKMAMGQREVEDTREYEEDG